MTSVANTEGGGSYCGQSVCRLPPQEQGWAVNQRLAVLTHPQGSRSCVPRAATEAIEGEMFGLSQAFPQSSEGGGRGHVVFLSVRHFLPKIHHPLLVCLHRNASSGSSIFPPDPCDFPWPDAGVEEESVVGHLWGPCADLGCLLGLLREACSAAASPGGEGGPGWLGWGREQAGEGRQILCGGS